MKKDAETKIIDELRRYDLNSVAAASGVHYSTLYRWIRGICRPRYATLLPVAETLGYTITTSIRKC